MANKGGEKEKRTRENRSGGVILGFGGGSADFIFMGAGIFLKSSPNTRLRLLQSWHEGARMLLVYPGTCLEKNIKDFEPKGLR